EDIHFLQSTDGFPYISPHTIVIDALFGSGLNKPLDGLSKQLVEHINAAGARIVSIDLPSGLYLDAASTGNTIIRAGHTLTFEALKLGLVLQDNALFIGKVEVLPIGLHPDFEATEESRYEMVEPTFVKAIYRPRSRFAHKGTYGHALLAAGSWGKVGAAVLAAKACLRSGVGLLTTYIPTCGYDIMQTALPEAMALTDANAVRLTTLPPDIEKYSAIGAGPGIGTDAATGAFLSALISNYRKPLVLDADALNLLAQQPHLLKSLPPGSILTPHPKEFDRLFGRHDTDFDRLASARRRAAEGGIIILLKGHHTAIATPSGTVYFNTTGNAGLAKGGSGDVLTGILTSLLAQGYAPVAAAVLGIYLHGAAADLCAATLGMESMLPGDLVLFFGGAFREINY
ncbi:MAG: NAD(P)H-hydrate dehydratase, partial [Flaviaesturariibacter sp.]|nr:NAD(P)H-hydrate dehydratase [Flaviaesturariibacter sp.]